MRILDLFSGIGGFSLGLESTGGFETVAFCEFDKAAQKVLKLRWPNVPIFEDIRGLNDTVKADIITGGFPCQPFSVAGKRSGTDDNRYLWPELLRVIRLVKPTWCILENVRGLLSIEDGMVFENCLLDLEADGYEHQTLVIPACAVNAQHRRDRVWIVGHASSIRGQDERRAVCGKDEKWQDIIGCRIIGASKNERENVAYACRPGREKFNPAAIADGSGYRAGRNAQRWPDGPTQPRLGGESYGISRWLDKSGLPKVSSGIPNRVNRLKQLGNSIVPQIAAAIGYAIIEAESRKGY